MYYFIIFIYFNTTILSLFLPLVKILTCNSVDKITNTIFHFMLLNILFTDAKVSRTENTAVASKLKTMAPTLEIDRSRVPASYATKSYLDA